MSERTKLLEKEVEILIKKNNTLKDENERLKCEVENYRYALDEEFDRANKYYNDSTTTELAYKNGYNDGVREFAKRLIDIAVGNWEHNVGVGTIDNLEKKLTKR